MSDNSIITKINNIFASNNHVYKSRVRIKTKNDILKQNLKLQNDEEELLDDDLDEKEFEELNNFDPKSIPEDERIINTIKLISENKISMGHARVLSKLEDEEKISELSNLILLKLLLSSNKNPIFSKFGW